VRQWSTSHNLDITSVMLCVIITYSDEIEIWWGRTVPPGIYEQCIDTPCNTSQHTAAHCNTLQRTAVNFSTLQRTAIDTLQYAATHCNTLQHTAIHCNTLEMRSPTLCVFFMLPQCTVLCYICIHACKEEERQSERSHVGTRFCAGEMMRQKEKRVRQRDRELDVLWAREWNTESETER